MCCMISLIINAGGQTPETGQQKSLDDVIVKETFQAGSEEEKLPVFLKADFSNLVEIKERIHWSSISWTYEGEKPAVETFTPRLSSPEFTGISSAPAKVFFLNFEDLASWKIDVLTSDGQKFRSLSGEGSPPKYVSWDGRGDDNSPLALGESYAYSFTAVDRAGNRRTFPGGAFSVPALYLKDNNAYWVGLSYATIFSPNGYGLTREAEDYASEVVNYITYFADEGKVSIESDHPLTDQFVGLVAKKLGTEVDYFHKKAPDKTQSKYLVIRIK